MSMIMTITNAGRQALVNAQNTGTLPLVISHVALGSARYNPVKTQTTLQTELKRVVSFGGGAVAPDVIHITIHDDSTDSYPLGEFGLITSTGVLFAVYSKPAEYILEKNANGILLLSVDTKITTLDITNIQFSGTNFILPPGSLTIAGILRLADSNEALAGENNNKAMTPKTTKEVMDAHKNSAEAHDWNQIRNRPVSIAEVAPVSELNDADQYTRGGHWLTPAANLVNFPQSVIAANTRAIVVVYGNNNGITQQVRSRNGDGRVYHRSAISFAALAGTAWIEERNSKNTLDIGTTAESARAAIGLPGWMGLGGGVHQITDMTTADVNVARIFRMNGTAVGGNGNFTGVISLPGDGTPITGYLGVSLHGIPYVGKKNGVNSIPIWNQIWDSNSQLALGTTPASARAAMGLAAIAATGSATDLIGQLNPARLPFSYSTASTAGYVVQRDGNGDISARRYKGSGVELQDLNASNINNGVVNDAYLPTTQTGKTFTSPIHVRKNVGNTPDFGSTQLVLRDEGNNTPVGISFWREGTTAVQLLHRSTDSLELMSANWGTYGDFSVRNINNYGTVFIRPAVHTGGLLEGGVRSYSPNAHNYGMGVNNNAGGLEFHASQAGAGMHRFYTGDFNTAIERVRITGATYALDVSGNAKANAFYGNGSNLTNITFSQLPFTPLQQAGGVGQLTNKLNIGWSSAAKLKLTVDASDYGNIALESWVTTNFATNNPTATTTEAQQGSVTALRQFSPALIKSAIDANIGNTFGLTNRQSITLTVGGGLYGGSFSYWRIGNLIFASFEFAMNEVGTSILKIANIPANATPWSSSFTPIYQKGAATAMLEARATGEIFLHMNAIFVTATGHAIWRAI